MGIKECSGKKVLVSGATPFDPQNRIKPFEAAACETTNREMRVFRKGSAGSRFVLLGGTITRPQLKPKLAGDNQPVAKVTAPEAEAYCRAQLNKNGTPGRLPTSEEWEKMARGPKDFTYATDDGTLKCGKNASCSLDAHMDDPSVVGLKENGCVYDAALDVWGCAKNLVGDTHIRGDMDASSVVGSFGKSGFGVYDAAGNVWEFAKGPDGDTHIRGGSWSYFDASDMRAGNRIAVGPDDWYNSVVGFRCVWPL